MVNFKFFLAILLTFFSLTTGILAIIFTSSSYNDVIQLSKINYHSGIFYTFGLQVNEGQFNLWSLIITGIAIIINSYFIFCLVKQSWLINEFKIIGNQVIITFYKIFIIIKGLSKLERITALLLILSLFLIRIYYLNVFYFTTDEIASFDFFVMEGLLAVTGFYPIPNNHIFSNLLCLGGYQFIDNPIMAMRIPTFLISLGGTLLMFVVLLRYLGFSVATLTISIFCISREVMFYSYAGRGYFLMTVLAFIAFSSMLHLMNKDENKKLHWLLFNVASILGFYSIPVFLYPFVSITIIGFSYSLFKKRALLLSIIISCIIISATTLILYLPILIISGFDALVNNKFIQPLGAELFWAKFPVFFNYTEGWLMGQERLGKYVLWIVIILTFTRIYLAKTKDVFNKICIPCLLMTLLPYGFIIIQETIAPGRSLLYKTFYIFLIAAFLFFWILDLIKVNGKIKLFLASSVVIIYSTYQLYYIEKDLRWLNFKQNQYKKTFAWLKETKFKNLLVLNAPYALFLNHDIKVSKYKGKVYSHENEGEKYDLLIKSKYDSDEKINQGSIGKRVYQNYFIQIFQIKR